MATEQRYSLGIELRARPDKSKTIVGYAAVFNSLSNELTMSDGRTYREVIRPGAFSDAIGPGRDVIARFEHGAILGRVSNGTLRLVEDQRGLRYEIDPPDTQAGRDTVALIARGDIFGSSFSFIVRRGGDTWRREATGLIRELRSVELLDVSPVSKPAYPATEVALRSWQAWQACPKNLMRLRLELAERT